MGKKYTSDCKGGEDCRDKRHLCKIVSSGKIENLRELIADARYYCRKCGRAAHDASSLCKPLNI